MSGYWSQSVQLEEGETGKRITKYNADHMSTMRVFCVWTGTIFQDMMLWTDTLLVIFISVGVAYGFHLFASPGYIEKNIVGHQKDFDTFVGYLGKLAVFLLGFYTSLSVSRWWRLRTNGVGNIWSAASQLTMYTACFVTQDPEVLDAYRRIARGSLALVFMQQRGTVDLDKLHTDKILTEEEVACLKVWKSNLAESIWTWAAQLVHRLHAQGLIKNDQILWTLMDRVNLGRGGAALIGAQQGTQLPMQYVHLLGFLVKLYTLVLGVTTGLLMSAELNQGIENKWVAILQTMAKAVVLPFLYNALLVINCQIANPFGYDIMDFPRNKYLAGIQGDAKSYEDASAHIPPWMSKVAAKPLAV